MDMFPGHLAGKFGKSERKARPSFVFWFLAGLGLATFDQLVKYQAFHSPDSSPFFYGFIEKKLFLNSQFAFSLPVPFAVMVVVYFLVLGWFVRFVISRARGFNLIQALAAVLILSGGFSNVAERLAFGAVRDFIYIWGGIFNLADFYILAGIIVFILGESIRPKNLP